MLGLAFDCEGEEAEENYNVHRSNEDGDDGFMYEEVDPNISNLRKKRMVIERIRVNDWFSFSFFFFFLQTYGLAKYI